MTPLQAITALVNDVTDNVKVMIVTSKVSSSTVAVQTGDERIVVDGQYKIGTRLIVSLGKVLGVEKQDDRVFYEQ